MTFSCIAPGIDEAKHDGETHRHLVGRLARAKASAVSAKQPEAWVIGSDQIAVLDGVETPLGKPGTEARCREQLRNCSGRTVEFLTAVALVRHENAPIEFIDCTRVVFRVLDQSAIERYVAKERPLDCAGGFKSEGLGISLCESIDSTDPSALIGLPLIRLSAALRAAGFEIP